MQTYALDRSAARPLLNIVTIFLATQVPALRAIFKYFPAPLITGSLFLLIALPGIVLVLNPPEVFRGFMQSRWPAALVAAAMAVASVTVYPYADALKWQGRGSDADDALIAAGQALWRFENPYVQTTYLGNSFTPGPGWALLVSPFSITGLYRFFLPATLAMAIWRLRAARYAWQDINKFLLLLASSLCVWELIAEGGDYLPFALLTLCALLGLKTASIGRPHVAMLTALLGALATFRLPFLLLPALIGFSLLSSFPRRAVFVSCCATAICLFLHAPFLAITGRDYPPLNLLLTKAEGSFSAAEFILAVSVCIILGLTMIVNWRGWQSLTHVACGLGVPWSIVSAAELASAGSFADWGGAGYFAMWLPFVILAVTVPRTGA